MKIIYLLSIFALLAVTVPASAQQQRQRGEATGERPPQQTETCYNKSFRLMPGNEVPGPVRRAHIRELRAAGGCTS